MLTRFALLPGALLLATPGFAADNPPKSGRAIAAAHARIAGGVRLTGIGGTRMGLGLANFAGKPRQRDCDERRPGCKMIVYDLE